MEDEGAIVALVDEQGVEHQFRLHDVFELAGVSYYLVEAIDGEDQVLLLRETGDGLTTLDDTEFDSVMAMLEEEEAEEVDARPEEPG